MKLSLVYEWFDKPDKKLYDGPIDSDDLHHIHECWNPAFGWCNHRGCQDYYLRLKKPNRLTPP